MLKRILAGVVLAVMLTGGAAAGPHEDFQNGLAASDRGDYATAMLLWRPLAENGNYAAQFNLGGMYYEGQGVTQDYAEAAKWWRLAANQNLGRAQGALGGMYYEGQGVPKNYVLAHMWFNLAVSNIPSSEAKIRDTAIL